MRSFFPTYSALCVRIFTFLRAKGVYERNEVLAINNAHHKATAHPLENICVRSIWRALLTVGLGSGCPFLAFPTFLAGFPSLDDAFLFFPFFATVPLGLSCSGANSMTFSSSMVAFGSSPLEIREFHAFAWPLDTLTGVTHFVNSLERSASTRQELPPSILHLLLPRGATD